MNSARSFKIRTILALWFTICLILFCAQASLADENPPARAARFSYLKGKVSFQPAGQDQWSEATLNFTVTTGDRLYTDKGARAELEVGPYTVRLAEQTDLIATNSLPTTLWKSTRLTLPYRSSHLAPTAPMPIPTRTVLW